MSIQNSINNTSSSFTSTTTITAGTGLTVTTGNATVTAGLIALPTTTSTAGQVTINGVRFLHNYGDATNVFIGAAGNFTMSGAVNNIGIGSTALDSLTDGDSNICIGTNAGTAITTGASNICIGTDACSLTATVNSNIGIGKNALKNAVLGYNVAIGGDALTALSGTGTTCIAIGYGALAAATTGTGNVAIGYYAANALTTPSGVVSIGNNSLLVATTPTNSTAIGSNAGTAVSTGTNNTLIGYGAGATITTGSYHTAIGTLAMELMATSTTGCTAIGYMAGNAFTSGGNTAIGSNAMLYPTSVIYSTAVGYQAMKGDGVTAPTGDYNTAVGYNALANYTTGGLNTMIGYPCGTAITAGTYNTAIGGKALDELTTGDYNVAIGACALTGALTSGSNNIGIGTISTTTGGGSALTGADHSNICIQNVGTAGDVHTIRIGTDGTGAGQQNATYIAGIYGATVSSATDYAVLVDSTHKLGTTTSSIRYKENVRDIGDDSDKIMSLRPVAFNYKINPKEQISYGLIAEEVAETFPYLARYKDGQIDAVAYHHLPVLLLNEVQKQRKLIKELDVRLSGLESKVVSN